MEFEVIDIREREAHRRQKIEWFRRLIDQRRHNAEVVWRYMRIYGRCLSADRVKRLAEHLDEVFESIEGMEREYLAMVNR